MKRQWKKVPGAVITGLKGAVKQSPKEWISGGMTVGKKIFLSFMVTILLMAILGGAGFRSISQMQHETDEIAGNWLRGVETINKLNYMTEHLLAMQWSLLLEPDVLIKNEIIPEAGRTFSDIEAAFADYEGTILDRDAADRQHFENLKAEWKVYKDIYVESISIGTSINIVDGAGIFAQRVKTVMEKSKQSYAKMQAEMDKLVELNHNGALEAAKRSSEVHTNAVISMSIVLVLSIVIAIGLSILITSNISGPVRKVSVALQHIARGDLTQEKLVIRNKDEIGQLVDSLNSMSLTLRATMMQIQEASDAVAASSEELLASSEENAKVTEHVTNSIQEVAVGSENQVQSAEETSRAMEEMAVGVQRIAESTSEVSELSLQASRQAEQGNMSVHSVVTVMQSINGAVERAGQDMKALEAHSRNIGNIVKLIGDIAQQTGLLALNANIEAARAGEHGRGFAVVAQEVRKLADQSAEAGKQIAAIIKQVQNDTLRAVETMDAGVSEVQTGIQRVSSVEEAFNNIVLATEEVSARIQDAAAAAQQMAASSEQVSASIHEMSGIAKQASSSAQNVAASSEEQLASVEEIASSANALSAIAQDLSDLVGKFKL
ncbi:methyl-accepting chemotaxis protein [Paenibacillus sp. y28]|uniref:methyl-accepting chemotaxis protein n=1 Tax=Paenibacillus sp. y28 TaxID=3129110 RepID=UPI0030199A2C